MGIQADPIAADGPLAAGRSHPLPAVYVANTGTAPAAITLSAQRISEGPQAVLPADWVRLGQPDGPVEPGAGLRVTVSVDIPQGAAPGDYLTNIVANTALPGAAGQAAVGAAASTTLLLSVADGDPAGFWASLIPGWGPGAVVSVLGGLGLVVLWRRSGLRMRIERAR